MNNQDNEKVFQKSQINWYPGHMAKTKRKIQDLMPLIDYVLEIVDSRIPVSSRIIDLNEIIKNKPIIVVMTKYDICDAEETNKWIKKYESDGTPIVAVSLKNDVDYKKVLTKIEELASAINESRKNKGLKPKNLRGLVIGIPNAGKSTLINKLARKKVSGVGNTPGYTKDLSWFKAGNTLLLDSPGILWPKINSDEVALNLSSMSAIKIEILPIHDIAVHILKKLDKYYPLILKSRYGLDFLDDDFEKNYRIIGQKIGAITKNNIDYNKVSLFIINDIKNENIKGITFDRCDNE